MSTALAAPPAYYSVNNPGDPAAVLSRKLVRQEYELWCALSGQMDPDQDSDILTASLTRSTGMARGFIQNNLMAMSTLDELPRLRALQEQLWHLDLHRLRAIDSALAPADRVYFDEVDEQLTHYLTATRPNQLVPGARAIQNKIKAILDELDDTIDTGDEGPDFSTDTYRLMFNPDGTAELSTRFSGARGVEIDLRVRALAQAEDIPLAEAHARLICGDEGVKVVLNAYRACDVEDAPAFVHRAGWLDLKTTGELVERATHVRDMDEASEITTESYRTPPSLQVFLEGRDSVCRGPDCTRPATESQKDHRINHADGGPTAASNLVNLCPRHHNLKTSGELFYVMDPHTGDIIWLLSNGSWFSDEAEGPLSRKAKLWLQSFTQRREARHKRARDEARHRKRMRNRADGVPEEDGPPPF